MSSSSPTLPAEIIREIVEDVAWNSVEDALSLAIVCRAINIWYFHPSSLFSASRPCLQDNTDYLSCRTTSTIPRRPYLPNICLASDHCRCQLQAKQSIKRFVPPGTEEIKSRVDYPGNTSRWKDSAHWLGFAKNKGLYSSITMIFDHDWR